MAMNAGAAAVDDVHDGSASDDAQRSATDDERAEPEVDSD